MSSLAETHTGIRVLILDYSVDRSEAAAISRWLPTDIDVTSISIDTEHSFPQDLLQRGFTHVIHTGSALSITSDAPFTKRAVDFIRYARDTGVAQFGICYGHQLLCRALLGVGSVRASPHGLEVGWGDVTFTEPAMQILGVGSDETVWQSHFDEVVRIPGGSRLLATNAHTEIQAYINDEQSLLGTQFHPEFDRESGNQLFLKESEFLAKHHVQAQELVTRGPSINAGEIFFGYFLQMPGDLPGPSEGQSEGPAARSSASPGDRR